MFHQPRNWKWMVPGQLMVFLLVGPATNLSSIGVIYKILKGWGTVRYLVAIVIVAILCGLAVDWIYNYFHIGSDYKIIDQRPHTGLLDLISASLLSILLIHSLIKKILNKFL